MASGWPTKTDTSGGFHPRFAVGPDVLSPARAALRLDGALERTVLSPKLHRFLLAWARLRNVHSSAKLEGNPIGLEDAQKALQKSKGANRNEEEILRLTKAYTEIHEAKVLPPLSAKDIVGLHKRLFDGVLPPDDRPGQLKNEPNVIKHLDTGRIVFEPTPPERTQAELEALLAWYYGDGQALDPAVGAGLFFVEFQAIHPFMEGNGRIGRLLNQRLLRASGFRKVTLTPLDGIIFRRSEKYYETLRATNTGKNYHVWLRFYANTLRKAYEEAVARGDLKPMLDRITAKSEREILEWALITGSEWFQRRDFPNPGGLADVTLSTALANLHHDGYLEREGNKRSAKYRLSEKLLKGIYDRETLA